MRLREIERAFAAAILSDDDEAIAEYVRPGRFGARRHVQIHRHNVYASLTGALEAVYPVIARLVGADCFRGCAHAYIRRSPPASGNLHDFGAGFGPFLADFEPVRALAYLPDMARLEWIWHEAFHAADAEPLALDALAAVSPEHYGRLRFGLHPSARLLDSPWPLLAIWHANQPGAPDETIDLRRGGGPLLVARRHLTVEIEALDEGEYALLRAFAQGASLAEAARTAVAQTRFDLKAALRRRVEDRTITRFELNQESTTEAAP